MKGRCQPTPSEDSDHTRMAEGWAGTVELVQSMIARVLALPYKKA